MTAFRLPGRARPGFEHQRWWVALFTLLICVMGFGAPATAQQLDQEVESLLSNLKADPQNYGTHPIPASSIDPISLDVHWRLFKRVAAGKEEVGSEEIEALARDAVSLGRRNSPAYATAVYALTASRVDEGALGLKQAEKFYDLAELLAPDLPYPVLAHSTHLIRHDLGRFPAAISLALSGLERSAHWLDTRVAWTLKFIAAGLIAALGAVLLFLLAQLLRNFGVICYDTSRLLPRGFSSNQTVILIVAITVVPGLLMRAPLLSVLILLGLLSLVQNLNERVVTLAIFGLLIALPSIDRQMSAQIVWPGSETQRLYHGQYLSCDTECQTNLAQSWLDAGDDPLLIYSTALAKYRDGRPENLAQVVQMLDEAPGWPEGMQPSVANLRGAAHLGLAEPDEAMKYFDQARDSTHSSLQAAAAFNRMRAYQMKDDPDGAARALQEAIKTDLSAVRTHLGLHRRDVNSFLLVEPLPGEVFWAAHVASQDESVSMVRPVWRALAGPLFELEHAPLAGGAGIILLLLGVPLRLGRRTSTPCPNCGLARDPRDAQKTGDHRYCLPCYQTFVSGASLEYAARVHNERVLSRRERIQDRLRRLLSLLAPGTGHCQAGHGLFGFLTAFFTLFGASILWRPMGVWRPAAELISENWAAQQTIAWILVSVGICIGLNGALRGIRPAQLKTRAKNTRDVHD